MDGENQRPLFLLEGFVMLSAPVLWESGFPSFIYSLSHILVIGASRCQMAFDPPLHRKQKSRRRLVQH
jgi:hypothetical protein